MLLYVTHVYLVSLSLKGLLCGLCTHLIPVSSFVREGFDRLLGVPEFLEKRIHCYQVLFLVDVFHVDVYLEEVYLVDLLRAACTYHRRCGAYDKHQ